MIILICVYLRSSVYPTGRRSAYICGKNLTNDNNRQFDDLTHVLTMQPNKILPIDSGLPSDTFNYVCRGTTMTLTALWDAKNQGYQTATLQASEDGKNLYSRLGFKEYGDFHIYQ